MYQILAESVEFGTRDDKNILVCFFSSQCGNQWLDNMYLPWSSYTILFAKL